MSNPTELPDLDRLEALTKAMLNAPTAVKAEVAQQEFHEAATPAAVLALIALARRAQPEGEAPQAVPVAWMHPETLDVIHDDRKRAWESDFGLGGKAKAGGYTKPLYTAPAAQHAESGAQAAYQPRSWTGNAITLASLLESLRTYSKCMPTAGRSQWAMAEAAKYIAAQSQGAHSAPGTPEAPKELGLDIAVAVNQRISKYIAGNKPALMLLNEEELAALYRFQETCEDSDSGGYDVDKDMMKRLAAIGVIESKGFGRYQFTEFGDFVVERAAQLDGGQGEEASHG